MAAVLKAALSRLKHGANPSTVEKLVVNTEKMWRKL
jgi:hypothetical protein